MEWSCIGDKPYCSAWPELLVVFQTFVIVQNAFFVFSGFQWLKGCYYLSVPQRGESQSAFIFSLITSQTLKQQLLNCTNRYFSGKG